MSKPRRCLVCGGPYYGYAKDRVKLHDISCTPELRALVRAAGMLAQYGPTCTHKKKSWKSCMSCRFRYRYARWLKAKERRKP